MIQRAKLLSLIADFCSEKGSRNFTLGELNENYNDFGEIEIGGKTPQATVRRLLQELRDEGNIEFLVKRGTYVLKGVEILKDEVEDRSIELINNTKKPNEKEYIIEAYARNRGWVKQARDKLGTACLYPKCTNSFFKEDGTLYIEVHHIIPLFRGGDDGIWNLTVICAHHHRMAHFADVKTQIAIEKFLLKEVAVRI